MSGMENNACKSLVVIGNGMDLSCKLKSTYNDFFSLRYSNEIISYFSGEVYYPNGIPKNVVDGYNLLDFLLLTTLKKSNKMIEWNDVESAIGVFLTVESPFTVGEIIRGHENMVLGFTQRTSEAILTKRKRIISSLMAQGVLPYTKSFTPGERSYKERLKDDFVKAVNEIENSFKKYLQDEVSRSSYYRHNLRLLYEFMLGEDLKKSFIINFNYTDELSSCFYEYEHVHGSLNSDLGVIFGIDESLVDMSDMYAYRMSKTFRKIRLDSLSKNDVKKMPRKIEKIVFFGHSLSVADYSYFQSIFDYYNIYDSDVDLIFYFVNYSKDAFPQCLEAITKLIKRYGETLDNKNHGHNLLHKLSLECRLKVKEIQIDYDEETNLITSIQ